MGMTLAGHIIAGTLALIFGYLALYAAKGGKLHRKSGMVFVYAMLVMAVFGITVSAVRGVAPALNIPIALLSAYLVITSLLTVKPPAAGSRWLNIGGLLVALAVGGTDFAFGFEAIAKGAGRDGIPAFMYFMFGVIALLASAGDARVIRSGPLQGGRRLARHLWRMCFALFVAALSFFIGQPQVFPQALRENPGIRALPVLAVLVTMLYWLWRVRRRRLRESTR